MRGLLMTRRTGIGIGNERGRLLGIRIYDEKIKYMNNT